MEVDEHSLHAPFAFEIYQEVLQKRKENYPEEPENLRNQLLDNDSWIETTDLGAGSKVNSGKQKQISRIARHEISSKGFSRILFNLIEFKNYQNILEIGTSLGVNSAYISLAAKNGKVWTIEGCPATAEVARSGFQKLGLENIQSLDGNADDLLADTLEDMGKVDLAYLDGNHTYEATIRYFKQIKPFLSEGAAVVIDDIYWSPGMEKAWEEICGSISHGLAMDLHSFGIIFLTNGPGMEKIRVKI